MKLNNNKSNRLRRKKIILFLLLFLLLLAILILLFVLKEDKKSVEIVDEGVMVGMYHTNANFEEANKGVDAGARTATHLGNVMTGLHHRDVGTLGACLLRDEVDCEMICDGLHISLPMIEIYLRAKNHDQLMMVSDNVVYAGLPVGRYQGFDAKSDRAFINITEDGFVLSDTGRLSGSSKPVLLVLKHIHILYLKVGH